MSERPIPKVSVVMPAYNAALFIAETIASVQAQTMPDWELLVTDDGSTDQTAALVEELASADPRIRLFRQKNGRQGKARNLALKHATAPWIAFLDADDLWEEDKLECQLNVVNEHTKVDLVYTSGISFTRSKEHVVRETIVDDGIRDTKQQFYKILQGYSLPVLSVMVKKTFLDKVGVFDEDLAIQNAEDYQLWLRLADANCAMYGLNRNLFCYRIHPNQTTFGDGYNFKEAILATGNAHLESITQKEKNEALKIRINRYLIHNLDVLSKEEAFEVMRLYIRPVKSIWLFFLSTVCFLISRQLLKRLAYRYYSLKFNQRGRK
jgi:glycosyltransferase involved in cell wall biosynthesis